MSQHFDIEKLIAWLKSPDNQQVDVAIAVSHHICLDDPNIDTLIEKVLQINDDIKLRRSALGFIVDRHNLKFRRILLDCLSDQDWCIRGKAFLGLKQIIPPEELSEIPEVSEYITKEMHAFGLFCIAQ